MKVIPDWKKSWRFWSVQLSVVGTALTSILVAFPDAAVQAWAVVPADLRNMIPPAYLPLIGVGVFAMSIVARILKQDKLDNDSQS